MYNTHVNSDVRYISKYRNTPGVSGYDTAMLVYRYFYKFRFSTIYDDVTFVSFYWKFLMKNGLDSEHESIYYNTFPP